MHKAYYESEYGSTQIQGRDDFPQWLTAHGLTGTGVEVGVYYGQFSEHLLKNWPGRLVGVDPYVKFPKEEWLDGCALVDLDAAMAQALETLAPFGDRFRLIRKKSVDAATEFEDSSLDFLYLDGNHDYAHVSEDIKAWWPKVKPGGVFAGHDYMNRNDAYQRCGVQQAVDEFCKREGRVPLLTSDTSFWIVK